ncbi:MAG: hypothetical protein KJ718_03415 [Nanoarchaeota archaeon]|nr:hypothetical protein [Nanoarchaeota archaeon]MBU1051578.1 hypothetical protein [Nanoarchaeota archaeon]MBU1988669.1 hypothetical protein [Nanoarchaeota archaeon]
MTKDKLFQEGKELAKNSPKVLKSDKSTIAYADELVIRGLNSDIIDMVTLGKTLYEKIGEGPPPAVSEYLTKKSQIRKISSLNRPQKRVAHRSSPTLIILAIAGLLLSLFFSTNTITGYTIAPLDKTFSMSAGILFFIVGIVISFILSKSGKST